MRLVPIENVRPNTVLGKTIYDIDGKLLLRAGVVLRENTIEKIITLWAPKSENPTEAYVRFICIKTGIKRNRPLSIYERRLIVAIIVAMTAFECRRYYPPISYVEAGYDLAVTE